MSVIDEVKDRIDIVEVIGESVKLRKSGKNFSVRVLSIPSEHPHTGLCRLP